MTPGRRDLQFQSFDQIMPDVDRLLLGHTTVGAWSLAQICRHLATVLRRVVDLPADTPLDPTQVVGPEFKRQVLESGRLPEGVPAPPVILPTDAGDPRDEAEGLRRAIAYFLASPGPVAPHRLFGPLTRDEWHLLQRIHCAHHLSFARPEPSPGP